MKETYQPPAIIRSDALEGEGIVPLVVAGVTVKAAAALLAGYVAGRAVAKVMDVRPSFKMPSLIKSRSDEHDLCMD